MQMQADIVDRPVHRSAEENLSARGAALLGGLALGWWNSLDEIAKLPKATEAFVPQMDAGSPGASARRLASCCSPRKTARRREGRKQAMITIHSYPIAVVLCVLTMICWGSWANTQKLAARSWRFELFYWDFVSGLAAHVAPGGIYAGHLRRDRATFPCRSCAGRSLRASVGRCSAARSGTPATCCLLPPSRSQVWPSAFPVGGGIAWVLGIVFSFVLVIVEGGVNPGNTRLLFVGVAVIVRCHRARA